MGKGKIGAQCGHAVLGAYRKAEKSASGSLIKNHLNLWLSEGQRKVVLKVNSLNEILDLQKKAEINKINHS